MTDKITPKHELQITLEEMARVVGHSSGSELSAMLRLLQMRGLVDHAQALAKRVGNEHRERKAPVGGAA
jgi:hypothetical protein